MFYKLNRIFLIFTIIILLFATCTKEIGIIKECQQPISFAGEDLLFVKIDSVILSASIPEVEEEAQWKILSGVDFHMLDKAKPHTVFYGKKGNHYTLEWIVENECGKISSDTIEISFACDTIFSDAGEDQLGNTQYKAKLNANLPDIEQTGKWTIIKGSGGKLDDENRYDATLSTLEEGIFKLVWTITNNCDEISKDTVIIEFVSPFNYGTVTDIDGNVYKTIQIGTQTWMAENLKTTKYNDGTPIANITSNEDWGNASGGSYCWYNYDIANKEKYGALYNNFSPIDKKVCPTDWHMPSDSDWLALMKYIDNKTKIYTTIEWQERPGGESRISYFWKSNKGMKYLSRKDGGTNSFGFNAIIPSGNSRADWWSRTPYPGHGNGYFSVYNEEVYQYDSPSNYRKSIRCVKN